MKTPQTKQKTYKHTQKYTFCTKKKIYTYIFFSMSHQKQKAKQINSNSHYNTLLYV